MIPMRCVCAHIYIHTNTRDFFYIYAHAWARLVRDLHMRVKQQIDIPFPHKIQRRRASFFQVQENKNKQKSTDGQYRTATNIVPSSSFLFPRELGIVTYEHLAMLSVEQ